MKKFLSVLFSICIIFCLSACGKPKCDHSYQNYIVKNPTCTEKGLLEKLCEVCGYKKYEDIAATGHNFINGKCTVCTQKGSSGRDIIPEPMPENVNNSAMWSMQEIYETSKKFGFEGTYEKFLFSLTGPVQDFYVDTLGFLHFTVIEDNELSLCFPYSKVSPENTKESQLASVYRLEINGENLLITYSDGVQIPAGKISMYASTHITGFGLNKNNEVVIYYSDNTIAFAGTILEGTPPENQSGFVYQQTVRGYNIVNVYSDEEIIKIPVSHKGKAIVSIASNTFHNVVGTVKSIIIPESVNFNSSSFSHLPSSTSLYFEKEEINTLPTTNAKIYTKNQWSYVNGIPTPND